MYVYLYVLLWELRYSASRTTIRELFSNGIFSILRSIEFRSGAKLISIQEFIRKFYLTIIIVIVISAYFRRSSFLLSFENITDAKTIIVLMSNIHLYAKKVIRHFQELSLISNSISFMNNVSLKIISGLQALGVQWVEKLIMLFSLSCLSQ